MKKIYLLTKTLLVAALLTVGANAWAGVTNIFNQASWVHTHDGGTGDRSSSLSFDGTSSIDDNWTASFDVTISSTFSRTNGSRNFQIALASASASFPSNALLTSNVLLGANFVTTGNTNYSSFPCTITVNDVTEAGTVTLNHDTKYTFTVSVNGTSMTVSIKNGESSVFSKAVTLAAFVKPKGIHDLLPRPLNATYGVYTDTYSDILLTKEVDEEAVSAPTISAPVYAGANRTVTITAGESSEDNSVTTYYTIDGTDPSSSNYEGSFTTATEEVTITSNCTVKTISISSEGTESDIVSRAITVGVLTLNAPTVSVSNLVLNGGVYNATYSFASDQSGILGSPTATISYTFAGGSSTEGTSYTPTTAGQLIVTASAAGYTSKSTTVNITLPNYIRTYYADFSTLVREDASGYSNYQINKVGCSFYSYTNTFDELTLSGFSLAWAITNSYVVGLHARGGAGTITYDESFVAGSIIDFSCANSTDAYHVYSTTATTTIPQYVGVYNMSIYSPTISTTISAVDYSTLASDYDLDFSVLSSTLKAYKATVSGSTITFTAVNTVPAGEGVLLKSVEDLATSTVFNIPVTTGVAAWADDDNAFVRGTGGAVATGTGPYNYVLSTKSGVVGFYQAAGLTVPDNKCYLQSATDAARITLDFADDSEVTGINAVNDEGLTVNGSVYDLQGRRVAQPKKGLYIMNGKKVVIK